MPDVELHPAYSWTCDECGRENFARAVVPESLEGELPEGFDDEAYDGVQWIMKPERVTCSACGAEFDVVEGD